MSFSNHQDNYQFTQSGEAAFFTREEYEEVVGESSANLKSKYREN